MNEELLRALFAIPEPVTVSEFCRRTGKTEPSVRKMVERGLLPLVTEREILGKEGSSRRLLILWNEWIEMTYDATRQLPPERKDWREHWINKAKTLARDLGLGFIFGK
ncbi:hypothetical protein HEM96_023970 [Escherichia coli]|nr:hypothetical protein [Escherichia coli]